LLNVYVVNKIAARTRHHTAKRHALLAVGSGHFMLHLSNVFESTYARIPPPSERDKTRGQTDRRKDPSIVLSPLP